MYTGPLPPVSNRAGWTFTAEIYDDETDELVDLSSSEITFEVRDGNGSPILSATTDNEKITVVSTGVFQAVFPETDMRTLCSKTYEVGCTVTQSGEEPTQFIIGTLPVLDGIVS